MDEDQVDKIQSSVEDFFDFSDAKKRFLDKFFERTGCKWDHKEFFEEKPGKFKLVDLKKKSELKEERK